MKAKAIRLPENYLNIVKQVAQREGLDEATILRKLLKIGAEKYLITLYERGDFSLRELANTLELSISETIDFLLSEGVKGNVRVSQILKSVEHI